MCEVATADKECANRVKSRSVIFDINSSQTVLRSVVLCR